MLVGDVEKLVAVVAEGRKEAPGGEGGELDALWGGWCGKEVVLRGVL